MADRYNNLNNTAPEVDPLKQKKPQIDKSDFDLSQALYFKTIDGAIVPFWSLRVLPNSSVDLNFNLRMIMTNPYVKELLSGKRAYVHVYHSDLSDLWEGADELIKKGRDFSTKLKIPTLKKALQKGQKIFSTMTAGSPACYLGLPVEYYDKTSGVTPIDQIKPIDLDNSDKVRITNYDNLEISALKLVMYQQIYQAHYLNKNLINNNDKWLPQIENHFILPIEASGQAVGCLSYDINEATQGHIDNNDDLNFHSMYYVPRQIPVSEGVKQYSYSDYPHLNVLRFRQFKGDMFTAGSPFPDLMRGDIPVMSFSDLTGTIDWSRLFESPSIDENIATLGFTFNNSSTPDPTKIRLSAYGVDTTDGTIGSVSSNATAALKSILNRAVVNVQNQLSFNLNALRALDVYTLLGERAARTDGTYNSFIKTMFNVDPRKHMHEPRYIGGFYLDFVNSTIEQTSETGNGTPLGTVASRGIARGNGNIGKFTFNDHGYLMAVLDIVDETVYTGGVERDWTDLTFEDTYLPLFNGLAPQATRVQELFLTGTKATNEEPFNYVERYSHLKSKQNKALGQMSLPAYVGETPIDLESASYLHTRNFQSKPEFNNLWVTMTPDNIDMTPYSNVNDYPFLVTAVASVNAVLPLPYITVPSGLSIMA